MTETLSLTKVNLCTTCEYEFANCKATEDDTKFGDGVGNDNVYQCKVYKEATTDTVNNRHIERLKQIKAQFELLSVEKKAIENNLPEQVIYQNYDNTWTRWTRTDNLKELMEKGEIYRAAPLNRFTTKLEILKNKPKELN